MKRLLVLLWLVSCVFCILNAETDNDFSDNTVLVVLKPEISDYSKSLDLSFFDNLLDVVTPFMGHGGVGGIPPSQIKVENISLITNERAIDALEARYASQKTTPFVSGTGGLKAHPYENEIKRYQSIYKITLPTHDKEQVLKAVDILNNIDGVDYATPNYILQLDVVPDDPYYGSQWALRGTQGIQAEQAWDITTGSQNIRVGVIDTGIATHPDLDANVTTGYDFFNNDTVTTDDVDGHGTHIAGIIGAVGDNETGIAGVNWNVTMVPYQITMYGSYIYNDGVISAIYRATNNWGTDEQISILNHSISGYGADPQDPRLVAINSYPGLFVWSAGNGGGDVDNFQFNYLDNIIAVGSIQSNGQKSDFSNYSASGANVHVYAPGSDILSTHLGDGYEYLGGTSMSAPHVSGVATMLLSVNPALTALQVKQIIINSADDITIEIPSGEQTVKRLNAHHALLLAISMSHIAVSPISYDFGAIEINDTSQNQTFTVSILGNSAYSIDFITITGENESDFNLNVSGLPWLLNSGGSETFSVSFTPTARGARTAKINIISNAGEFQHIIDLSGTGWNGSDTIPYQQDFNQLFSLNEISWSGTPGLSGITRNWGINLSKGLTVVMNEYIYTTSMTGITANTILSFNYRLCDTYAGFYLLYPPDHLPFATGDKVYIEVSTTGATGAYTVVHEINNTNHAPATVTEPFSFLEIPLSAYASQTINIRFRVATEDSMDGWAFNLDDFVINDCPAPASLAASVSANNVTLSWTPPPNSENLIGYMPYRGDTPLLQTPTTSLNYTDEGLSQGDYCYGIRAVYNDGMSNRRTMMVEVGPVAFLPYTLDFNNVTDLSSIGWSDSFLAMQGNGVFAFSGVNSTNGLVLAKYIDGGIFGYIIFPQLYSPVFIGITENTTLSFAYRIVNYTNDWLGALTATTLNADDKVTIDASTTGINGTFTRLYDINHTNHTASTSFSTVSIPLSDYAGQELTLFFSTEDNYWFTMEWSCVIDDIVIADNATQGPPRDLVATPDFHSVRLTWQAPASAIPMGYKVYRDGEAITGAITDLYYQDDNVTNGVEYTYYVTAVYADGLEVASETVTAIPGPGAEFDEVSMPLVTGLHGNYPNPFNPETVLSFSLAREGFVSIDVYNVRGQKVRGLVSGVYGAGVHKVVWNGVSDNGRSVGSGVYFYRMSAGGYTGVRKMLLLK